MNVLRILSGTALIGVVILSIYFGAVAAAPKPSAVGRSLILYQLGPNGHYVGTASNLFESGAEVGVAVPQAASPPYTLGLAGVSSQGIWSQQNSSLPLSGLIPLSLAPTLFPPGQYLVSLRVMIQYSPGFFSPQMATASLTIVPAAAKIQVSSSSFLNNTLRAQITLQDSTGNPLAGVRLGLFLSEGNNSIELTTEKTSPFGAGSFQLGTSLSGGHYPFEVRVLDSNSVYTTPVQVPEIVVNHVPTTLVAWIPAPGSIQTRLNRSDTQGPVTGRLLFLEQRLPDGNWTITSQGYTDNSGGILFYANTTKTLRVSFKGDQFYSPSVSISPRAGGGVAPASISPLAPSISSSSLGADAVSSGLASPLSGGPVPCGPIGGQPQTMHSQVQPYCGGGGCTCGATPTITTTIIPSSSYATIPVVLAGLVQDTNGNPVAGGYVWWVDNNTSILGNSLTNSTGYATMVWIAGITGSQTIHANFAGNSVYTNSYGNDLILNVQKTPTTIQMLQPQQIAFSWDLYNYYSGNGLPIVVPVNILSLALSGSGAPANIYMPPYNGISTTPTPQAGYGWAGLNQTSIVTINFNSTYIQTQNVNWTRNFYLPPCPNPTYCSTSPRTGHMYLLASILPPNALYAASMTALNIPYQLVQTSNATSSQLQQSSMPIQTNYPVPYPTTCLNPGCLNFASVNVSTPLAYMSMQMAGIPVALNGYTASIAYGVTSPNERCGSNGCNAALPIISSNQGVDYLYIVGQCFPAYCTPAPAGTIVKLYNSIGQYCLSVTTDNSGVATLDVQGSGNCTYPYSSASASNTISGFYVTEAQIPFSALLTNFQGYTYAPYAPKRVGQYLAHVQPYSTGSEFTVLNPSTSYPNVKPLFQTCNVCDTFFTALKHPVNATATISPSAPTLATIFDNVNSTIHSNDMATGRPIANVPLSYSLTRTSPGPTSISSGASTTNANGSITLRLGKLLYGNYSLGISWPGNTTMNALSSTFTFTVYKALPSLVLRDVSSIRSATTGIIRFINPGGVASTPTIVHPQASPYEFYEVIGASSDISSAHFNVWYFSACCSIGRQNGQVVFFSWSGGQPSGGMIACAQSQFTNCSYNLARLTGTSNICGATYCYRFSVFAGSINTLPLGWYLNVDVGACVSSNTNCANNCWDINCYNACGSGYTPNCNWAYLDNPDGSILVNGVNVRRSDLNAAAGTIVGFQFNATSAPNSIASVTMTLFNQTSSTSKSICLIGGPSCLQPAQTSAGSFILYPPSKISFRPGNYNLTVTMSCPSCAQTSIEVVSLVLIVPQSGWSENGLVHTQYSYEASLINNAIDSQVTMTGLTETIYINGIFYTTLQTDTNGNTIFTWTPQTAGQYTIGAVFFGQNYYTNCSSTIMVSIARRNVVLAANNSPQIASVNHPVTWNVYAQDMVSNSSLASLPISLFINGVNTTTVNTSSGGTAVFQPPASTFGSKGSYNVTFVSATNNVYNSGRNYDPLMVYLDTKLTLQAGTITLGQQNTFTVSLKDANGVALSGRVIGIELSGAFYQNATTDGNGLAQFNWRPDNTGTYTVTARFLGTGPTDFGYRPSASALTFNLAPSSTTDTQSSSRGTQSVYLATASGTPQTSLGFAISITFPSVGWTNVNVASNGQSYSGTLHVWNEFGANCIATVFGTCVLWAPSWKVHFDEVTNINGGALSAVIDFFSGTVQSAASTFGGIPIPFDPNSVAFTQGQNAANAAFTASVATYLAIILGSSGVGEPAAAPAAIGVLWAFSLGTGIAAFLAYNDKASKENFLAGELLAVGLGILGKFVAVPPGPCNWPCIPLIDFGWVAYWSTIFASTPWGRVVLLTGLYGLILTVLEVLLLVEIMP